MRVSPHHVELVVPASAHYVEPVRLTAAALGAEVGLDVEEVDDIRIAVHELFVLLLAENQQQPSPPALPTDAVDPARVELRFELLRDRACLLIRGRRLDEGPHGVVEIDDMTRAIVSAATDRWELSLDGRAAFDVEKVHHGR